MMNTISELFPHLNKQLLERCLWDGATISEADTFRPDDFRILIDLRIVTSQTRDFVKCANPADEDYHLQVVDQGCDGEIELHESSCPVCGRQIDDYYDKQPFQKMYLRLDYEGISQYLSDVISRNPLVEKVESEGKHLFHLELNNGRSLTVVLIIPRMSMYELYSAIYFGNTPTLHVYCSPGHMPHAHKLEKLEFFWLGDILSSPEEKLSEILRVGSSTDKFLSRTSYAECLQKLNARFPDGKAYQEFEQVFVPAFVNRISQETDKLRNYLDFLKKYDRTILGMYTVPIGGPGNPDFRQINKFEMMNAAFEGPNIGDAKCYADGTQLTSEEIKTISLHLLESGAPTSIVVLRNNNVPPSTWNHILQMRDAQRAWKIVIIPQYLILELLSALDAYDLLER